MSTGELEQESSTTTAEGVEGAEVEEKVKLDLDVTITDVGPCKKHMKVVISKKEIDRQFEESIGTVKREAAMPGFRPGRAPRQLVQKRFRKEVAGQVKQTLLMTALEQIDEDYKLNPITQPDLDIAAIELPEDGPMHFEMDVEVRPEFSLPEYKGLTVKRPVKTITNEDVESQYKQFLERFGLIVPKFEGGAEIGDFVTADLHFFDGPKTLNLVKEIQFRLQPELRYQDGSVPNVGEVLKGVLPGETREADTQIGSGSVNPELRGKTVKVAFTVHDLKQMRLPETTPAFFHQQGFDSEEDLRGALRRILETRLAAVQTQALRNDIMNTLINQVPFDLPSDLVARQEKTTIRRLVAELREQGLDDSGIRAREAEIRTNAHESTLQSLKEFFLLAKIAEAEDIKVEDSDIEDEITAISIRSDESVRRVRTRLEKENLTDILASQILERKTIDRILELVTFEEVPLVENNLEVETLDQTVSPEAEPTEEASTNAEGETPA